jgi:hypothetical protein
MAENGKAAPAQTLEIDRAIGVIVSIRWQCIGNEVRHPPAPAAVVAGRNHDRPRQPRDVATGVSHVDRDHAFGRPNVHHLGVVLDGEAERCAVPAQIVHPCRARNAVDSRPGAAPEARVEPSLHR